MAEPKTEITPRAPDADAVARAATERAEKLERQNAELKKQLETVRKGKEPSGGGDAEQLRAEIARLQEERAEFLEQMRTAGELAREAKRGAKPLAPEHRGTKQYRIEKPHYRGGLTYGRGQMAGPIITVTDERPGKGWVEVKKVAATQMADVEPPAEVKKLRSADTEL